MAFWVFLIPFNLKWVLLNFVHAKMDFRLIEFEMMIMVFFSVHPNFFDWVQFLSNLGL